MRNECCWGENSAFLVCGWKISNSQMMHCVIFPSNSFFTFQMMKKPFYDSEFCWDHNHCTASQRDIFEPLVIRLPSLPSSALYRQWVKLNLQGFLLLFLCTCYFPLFTSRGRCKNNTKETNHVSFTTFLLQLFRPGGKFKKQVLFISTLTAGPGFGRVKSNV